MATLASTIHVSTRGHNDVHDLTSGVEAVVRRSNVDCGTATIFVSGSTAGITTIEFEPGVVNDLKQAIDRLAPSELHYDHDARWGDGNGYAHVRAALLGPSLTVPIVEGRMQLGTWQQIILVDFDNRPRERDIVIQVTGDVRTKG